MEYLKLDPKFRRQPKPKRAGWVARETFLFLVQVCGDYDLRGRISPSRQDLDWLTDEWATSRADEEELAQVLAIPLRDFIARGIADCEIAGLLIRDGEELVIEGWEQMYSRAKTPAERAEEYRLRKMANVRSGSQLNPPAPAVPVTNVTPVTTTVTSHATRRDETRRDETKQKPAASPPSSNVDPAILKRCMDARERALPDAVAEDFARIRPSFEKAYAEAMRERTMTPDRFERAYVTRFLRDEHWRGESPPCPMGAFVAQWRSFVPDQGNAPAAPTHRILEFKTKAGGAA